MKKILTILIISLAFIMTSCGFNNFSNEEGTVSFTIPAEQVQDLARQASMADARVSAGTYDVSLFFLVQVTGSKGYYEKQTKVVGKTYSQDDIGGKTLSDFSTMTKDVSFSFEGLKSKQTYTVLADVFFRYDYPDDNNPNSNNRDVVLVPDYSLGMLAESDVIKVKGSSATPVTLSLMQSNYKNTDIIVEYDKNGVTESKRINSADFTNDNSATISAKFAYKNQDMYFKYQGFPWYKVKSVKAVLSDNTHFKKGFEIKGTGYDFDASAKSIKEVEIPCVNGTYDITKYLEKGFALYTTFDGYLLSIDQILNIRIADSIDALDTVYYDSDEALTFIHTAEDYGNNAGTYRYRATIPLSSLFPYETPAANDTIVFIFNVEDSDDLPLVYDDQNNQYVGQLYYKLQNAGWESLTPEEKDNGNNCIDYSQNTNSFIMACNFIKGTEKYLQIFFDTTEEVSSKTIECNISYKKYDASERVFAFRSNVAYNGQGKVIPSRYRWEAHMPFDMDYDQIITENGENYWLYLNPLGELQEVLSNGETKSLNGTSFYATIFDSSEFASGVQGHNNYYDILSQDEPNWTYGQYDITNMKFSFVPIRVPGQTTTGTHKYHLQCYSDISDWDAFLIIRNYTGVDVTAEPQA